MNKVKYKIQPEKVAGEWGVSFTIGNQTFQVRTFSETNKDALWHAKMLKIAFKNLTK